MITIDLRIPMTVTVPDKAKVEHIYTLTAGLNDVPPEVAEHWYVKKFTVPVRRVPRTVVPSSARPRMLPPAAVAAMGEALKPVVAAPAAEPAAPAPAIPPVTEKAAKA
jgi:hypothetical protein